MTITHCSTRSSGGRPGVGWHCGYHSSFMAQLPMVSFPAFPIFFQKKIDVANLDWHHCWPVYTAEAWWCRLNPSSSGKWYGRVQKRKILSSGVCIKIDKHIIARSKSNECDWSDLMQCSKHWIFGHQFKSLSISPRYRKEMLNLEKFFKSLNHSEPLFGVISQHNCCTFVQIMLMMLKDRKNERREKKYF